MDGAHNGPRNPPDDQPVQTDRGTEPRKVPEPSSPKKPEPMPPAPESGPEE